MCSLEYPTKKLYKYTSGLSVCFSLTFIITSIIGLSGKKPDYSNLPIFFAYLIMLIFEFRILRACSRKCELFHSKLEKNNYKLMKGLIYFFSSIGIFFSFEISHYWMTIAAGGIMNIIGIIFLYISISNFKYDKNPSRKSKRTDSITKFLEKNSLSSDA